MIPVNLIIEFLQLVQKYVQTMKVQSAALIDVAIQFWQHSLVDVAQNGQNVCVDVEIGQMWQEIIADQKT